MGSSFTRYRGVGFWTNDATIELWLFMLSREVEKLPQPPDWLSRAGEQWRVTSTCGMIGCVSACLDEYASTTESIGIIMQVAEGALSELRSKGESLSVDWLNSLALGSPGDAFTRDLPTEMFTQVGKAFIELLNGEFSVGSSDAPHTGP